MDRLVIRMVRVRVRPMLPDMEEKGEGDVCRRDGQQTATDQARDVSSRVYHKTVVARATHIKVTVIKMMITPSTQAVPEHLLARPIPVMMVAAIQKTNSMQFKIEYAFRLPQRRNLGTRSVKTSYESTTSDLTD